MKGLLPDIRPFLDPHAWVKDHHGCWIWIGWISPDGYGQFMQRRKADGRFVHISANRYHYQHTRKMPLEAHRIVGHLCAVKRCVNPCHGKSMTRAEANRRYWRRWRRAKRGLAPEVHVSCLVYTPAVCRWLRQRTRNRA